VGPSECEGALKEKRSQEKRVEEKGTVARHPEGCIEHPESSDRWRKRKTTEEGASKRLVRESQLGQMPMMVDPRYRRPQEGSEVTGGRLIKGLVIKMLKNRPYMGFPGTTSVKGDFLNTDDIVNALVAETNFRLN